MYIYTHQQSQNSPTKTKYNRLTQQRKKKEKKRNLCKVVKNSQNSLMDSVGEGEGGKIWENGIETCETSCILSIFQLSCVHPNHVPNLSRSLERHHHHTGTHPTSFSHWDHCNDCLTASSPPPLLLTMQSPHGRKADLLKGKTDNVNLLSKFISYLSNSQNNI